MSWLMRTGTGRTNISWGGGSTTSGNYLRRTADSRNSISYLQISSNGTYRLLERTASGRNNIRWNNLTFNFFTPYTIGELFNNGYLTSNDNKGIFNAQWYDDGDREWLAIMLDRSNNPNGYGTNAIYHDEHSSPRGVSYDWGGAGTINTFTVILASDSASNADYVRRSIANKYNYIQFEQRSGNNFTSVNTSSRRNYQIHSITNPGLADNYNLTVSSTATFSLLSTFRGKYLTEIVLYSDTGSSRPIPPTLQEGGSSGYYPLLYFH